MTRGLALSGCLLAVVFATGISACGDGVLQTSEVERSLRDAGYPNPTVAKSAEASRGLSDLISMFSDADVVTDTVSVPPRGGADDAFVVAVVYVDPESGKGVGIGAPRPEVTVHEGDEIEALAGGDALPGGFDLRRVRVATVCNAQLSAYEEGAEDDRFDRAVGYLTARC